MYGIIDIGSNTIRLSMYKVVNKAGVQPLFHKKSSAGLAGYIDEEGNLSEKGINKAVKVLADFKMIIDSISLKKVYAFATASLRNINNANQVVERILENTGIKVEIISGEDEATYDFLGATYCMELQDGILVDIGGGSTELVFYEQGNMIKALSIPIGSLNLYMKYVKRLLPSEKEVSKIKDVVKGYLDAIELNNKEYATLCGIGGSARATCKLYNEFTSISSKNREMNTKEIKKLLEHLNEDKKENYVEILQVVPERIHTIIPGMILLSTIAKYYQCKTMVVSEYGVREGYLINQLMQEEGNG